MSNLISNLSPHLFWDVDFAKLDADKHYRLIIERIIERGTFNQFRQVEKYYGKEKLIDVIKNINTMNEKDMNFVSSYFNIPFELMKCYIKTLR